MAASDQSVKTRSFEWWMGRGGLIGPFTVGHAARLVGSLGLAVLGLMTGNAPLIVTCSSH